MAVVERDKEFKPVCRLWLHIKILYFLLCVLCMLTIVTLLLFWHVNQAISGKYSNGLCGPVFQRKNIVELVRVKRHSRNVKNIEDRGIKENLLPGIKTRNQTDWVWMSSFSRIPAQTLQGFCASTKDYCPPGFPGLPGRKGEVGKPGENGIPGNDGLHGTDGEKGTTGHKGEPGIQGPPGNKGLTGFRGEKGSQGETGAPGRRGEKGDKGDKGDVIVQFRNCSCPQGPKGNKGEPGYFSSDSQVTWMKEYDKHLSENTSSSSNQTVHISSESCRIRLVSKPQFQKQTGAVWGSWLRDLSTKEAFSKVWVTKYFTDNVLYEYSTMTNFRKERISKVYELQYYFLGTGHVVFQGCFYYHRAGYNEIVQYSLKEQVTTARLSVEGATYSGNMFLYSTEYNYIDLSVDENGLWAIYSNESDTDKIMVAKINHTDLSFSSVLNIFVDRRQYGNGFIACGTLYLVRDTRSKITHIDYAFDLFKKQNIPVHLQFISPFQMNNMVTYIPELKNIFAWDKGNQLIYNVTV